MKFKLDKTYRFLAITWDDGWDFAQPTVLLSPIVRCREDGAGPDYAIEDAILDISMDIEEDKETRTDTQTTDFVDDRHHWRGWNLKTLKRRAREALNGKEFPMRSYSTEECFGKFVKDEKGEVQFQEVA